MLSKKSSSDTVETVVAETVAPVPRKLHPYFNRTLFFKNVTRFWPIWLCYTVIWAFCLPVQIFVEMLNTRRLGLNTSDMIYLAERTILSMTSDEGVLLSMGFGLLAAVAVFSYLFSARSTGLMHTLPIKRGGLFFTNYLSGLCFLLIPNILIALLTFLAESAAGTLIGWNIVLWLLIQSGTAFFFYTFAVFCGMFTGNIIAMPVFYGIFNALAYVLYAILDSVMNMFVFGYDGISWAESLVEWLTPAAKLINGLRFRTVMENGVEVRLFTGYQYVLAYCGVALVLLIAALYLYEARHMETAGDVIALSWAKPVFKFGFAFCAALCGGMVLYYTFGTLFESETVFFTVACVLAGVIGCFVAEMLLQKSFKVFRKGWLSTGIFSVCIVLLLVGLSSDVMGIENWVPDPARVASLSLNGSSLAPYDSGDRSIRALEDPEDIEKVVALHRNIVNDRAFYKVFREDYLRGGENGATWEYHYINIDYTMRDGSIVSRSYSIPFNVSSNAPDPDSVEGIYLSLMSDIDFLLQNYFPGEELNARPVAGSLTVFNTETRLFEDVEFDAQQTALLAKAAREDIEAGRLGIRYLSDSGEERQTNCSYHDLRLEWYYTVEEPTHAMDALSGKVTVKTESYSRTFSSQITPQYTATSLMDTLYELGALDDTHVLLSHAEYVKIANVNADFGYYDPEYGYYK